MFHCLIKVREVYIKNEFCQFIIIQLIYIHLLCSLFEICTVISVLHDMHKKIFKH